jgi:ribose 5-phosphate isomerase B
MRVVVGSDHLGRALKDQVKDHVVARGHEVVDVSQGDVVEVDYPDVAVVAATRVAEGESDAAILVCGTGIGMAIAANKVKGVRAAAVSDPYSAERARASNNAQVLCLGSKIIGAELAAILVDHWLDSTFQGGASGRKVDKLNALDLGA